MMHGATVRILGVALVSLVASRDAAWARQSPPQESTIAMSGEGLVKAQPDQAFVMLATESRSKNPKDAQSQNATTMTAVQQKLAAAGIPKDAIRTLSYDLQLESDWVNGRQVPRGYLARNVIEVRLEGTTRVGEVIDLAVSSGVNSVQHVRFDLKERESLEREALKRAAADAHGRAQAVAAGVNATLGRVLRVEEPSAMARPYAAPPMAMMREAAGDSRASTPFVAGEIELRATVIVTFAIEKR